MKAGIKKEPLKIRGFPAFLSVTAVFAVYYNAC
jgi:hypothetical protein